MRRFATITSAVALSACLFAAPAQAQPAAVNHGIGIYVSNIAGSGLTYVRELGQGWGFHISGIGWSQSSSAFFNVGGAITKEIDRRDWGRLYGLLAAGTGTDIFAGGSGLSGGVNLQTNLTPGIGLEWGPVFVEAGYSIYYNNSGPGFTPAGGAGLVWRF